MVAVEMGGVAVAVEMEEEAILVGMLACSREEIVVDSKNHQVSCWERALQRQGSLANETCEAVDVYLFVCLPPIFWSWLFAFFYIYLSVSMNSICHMYLTSLLTNRFVKSIFFVCACAVCMCALCVFCGIPRFVCLSQRLSSSANLPKF